MTVARALPSPSSRWRRPVDEAALSPLAATLRSSRTGKIVETEHWHAGSQRMMQAIGPMSQNELARHAGCDPAYINQLERSKAKKPPVVGRGIVLAIANALELDDDDTDRLLFAAGLAPTRDWQAIANDPLHRVQALKKAMGDIARRAQSQ